MKNRLSCCDTVAKILLIIFNSIFWAFGIAILGVGLWIKFDPALSNLGQAIKVGDSEPVVEIITWLFIGAGIFVFAVGVVGIIGIIRESKIMMGFYVVCIFIVFAAEASAGVYAGVRKDYIIEQIEKEGAEFIKTKYTNEPNRDDPDNAAILLVSRGFNFAQVKFNCCGVVDFYDYHGSTYLNKLREKDMVKPGATLSWACCKTTTGVEDAFKEKGELTVDADTREECMLESIDATIEYNKTKSAVDTCSTAENFRCQKGCVSSIVEWTESNIVVMLAIAIAIGVSQLILMFLALWFCQSLGSQDKN